MTGTLPIGDSSSRARSRTLRWAAPLDAGDFSGVENHPRAAAEDAVALNTKRRIHPYSDWSDDLYGCIPNVFQGLRSCRHG